MITLQLFIDQTEERLAVLETAHAEYVKRTDDKILELTEDLKTLERQLDRLEDEVRYPE